VLPRMDQALKADPNHIPALIGKGDLFARLGDERAASAHYGVAVRLAERLPSQPTEWRAEIDRSAAARRRMTVSAKTTAWLRGFEDNGRAASRARRARLVG